MVSFQLCARFPSLSFFSKEAVEQYLRYFRTNSVEISSTSPSFKFRVREMPFFQKESGFSVYVNFNFKCEEFLNLEDFPEDFC